MLLVNRRSLVASAGALAVTAALDGVAAAAVEYKVHTAGAQGANVDSTLILGRRKALLIDAQFTVPDAQALVRTIEAGGRDLETVFITHYHPDHHLGLAVIAARFPGAKAVAHPAVAAKINAAAAGQLASMRSRAPAAFAERTVTVAPLEGRLMLEGEVLELIGPLRGDTELITPVWVPQLKTMVATDVVYNATHVWLAEATTSAALDGWRASLDRLASFDPAVIVPGHRTDAAANDLSGLQHTRNYLAAWQSALAVARTAEALKAEMIQRVGSLPGGFFLDMAVKAARP